MSYGIEYKQLDVLYSCTLTLKGKGFCETQKFKGNKQMSSSQGRGFNSASIMFRLHDG